MEDLSQVTEFKVYKEHSYKNSKGEPFGVSIKGRAKDYILAHKNVRQIFKKGKIYNAKYKPSPKEELKSGKMKILSINEINLIFDMVVEVTLESGHRGIVIMKSYNPGKRGATTELRRHPDSEYEFVDYLKSMLTIFLDRCIDGETIEDVLNNDAKIPKASMFSCNICNYKTWSTSGLKTHQTRIHKVGAIKCSSCDSTFENKTKLQVHMIESHGETGSKKRKMSSTEKKTEEKSPSLSPLRKKMLNEEQIDLIAKQDDIINDGSQTQDTDVEMDVNEIVDFLVDSVEDSNQKEDSNEKDEREHKTDELNKSKSSVKISSSKEEVKCFESKSLMKVQGHLKGVKEEHLKNLKGLKMRYCAPGDGACLFSCLAAHISSTEDENERKYLNKLVKNHIADNLELYYKEKICLPYVETIGVGSKAREIICNSQEEFLQFLRSDDSLYVYAKSFEITAIANIFNINVNIFTYGIGGEKNRCQWYHYSPDTEWKSVFPKGSFPDMNLYNSDMDHYDLLVPENHRLSILGFVGKSGFNHVKKKDTENLLADNAKDYDSFELEELDDEVKFLQEIQLEAKCKNCDVSFKDKASLEAHMKQKQMFNCSTCANTFKTEGALKVHSRTHLAKNCKVCDRRFLTDESLRRHMTLSHSTQEWNCNDCSFQAHTSEELRNHLRLKGHQPCHNLEDSKSELVTCYTCKKDFLSYWSLMNHRKQEHPSNKTCRYFLKNQCIHGVNCWYRHDESMDLDSSQNSVKSRIQTSKKCEKDKKKI